MHELKNIADRAQRLAAEMNSTLDRVEKKSPIKQYVDISVQASIADGGINIRTEFSGVINEVFHKRVELEDKAVREALIKLGWTPPKDEQ